MTIELVNEEEYTSIRKPRNIKKRYTKEQIISTIRKFLKEKERIPTENDFRNNPEYPSPSTVQRIFGSWNNAIIESGLPINVTDEELLEDLRRYERENGRPPREKDLINNPKFYGHTIYQKRFGGLQKALKLVGSDVDSMVKKGILVDNYHKGRLFEMFVIEHFHNKEVVDLSGENCLSYIDGICPKGETYDAKSAALRGYRYTYRLAKRVDHYYLGAFDEDYSELQHVWRIPGDFHCGGLSIWIDNSYVYNLENMAKYEITERFLPIFNKWIDSIL